MNERLNTANTAAVTAARETDTAALLRRAMQRRMAARAARRSTMWAALTPSQRAAQRTRTDAQFAFCAARGKGLFHRPNCPHLHGEEHLQGFSQYGAARARGYVPCPHCSPTADMSLPLYIPAESERRDEDEAALLGTFCTEQGAVLLSRADARYLQTASGKWKLQNKDGFFFVGHIAKQQLRRDAGYKMQPCVFLSLTDALAYIAAQNEAAAHGSTAVQSLGRMPAARSKDN